MEMYRFERSVDFDIHAVTINWGLIFNDDLSVVAMAKNGELSIAPLLQVSAH
jgi:hypothetical protein